MEGKTTSETAPATRPWTGPRAWLTWSRDPWVRFWLVVALITGLLSLAMASRYTWVANATNVPVIGETILQPDGRPIIVGTPEVRYAAEPEHFLFIPYTWQSISTNFKTGSTAGEIDLLVSHLIFPLCTSPNAEVIGAGRFLARQRMVLRSDEPTRDIEVFRVRVKVKPNSSVLVYCRVGDEPGSDSYVTRNIRYMPLSPFTRSGTPLVPGFRPLWPQLVRFEVSGNIDLAVTGGEIAQDPLAQLFEEREVGPKTVTLRARWTSLQAQARRDFGLFLAAIMAGISVSALVEFSRRIFKKVLVARHIEDED